MLAQNVITQSRCLLVPIFAEREPIYALPGIFWRLQRSSYNYEPQVPTNLNWLPKIVIGLRVSLVNLRIEGWVLDMRHGVDALFYRYGLLFR